MIEFKEGREFIGVWYVIGHKQDWMGAVWREGDGPWQLAYRFRYYMDERVHDSDDVKNWYTGEAMPGTPTETIINGMNRIAEALPNGERHFLDMRGLGFEAQFKKITNAPWSHVQTTAPGGDA